MQRREALKRLFVATGLVSAINSVARADDDGTFYRPSDQLLADHTLHCPECGEQLLQSPHPTDNTIAIYEHVSALTSCSRADKKWQLDRGMHARPYNESPDPNPWDDPNLTID